MSKIEDTIRSLLNMANCETASENERRMAQDLIQKYVKQYNIDMAKLGQKSDFVIQMIFEGDCDHMKIYDRTMLGAIRTIFDISVLMFRYDFKKQDGRVVKRHGARAIGEKELVQLAISAFNFFRAMMVTMSKTYQAKDRHSFRYGFAYGIGQQAADFAAEMVAENNKEAGIQLYKADREQRLNDFVSKHFNVLQGKRVNTDYDESIFSAGFAEGRKVNVSGHRRKRIDEQ